MKHYRQWVMNCVDTDRGETTEIRFLVTEKEQLRGTQKVIARKLAAANRWNFWTSYFEKEVTVYN